MKKLFTTRSGGLSTGAYRSFNLATHVGDDVSVVRENRLLLSRSYGEMQYMNQVHGSQVVIVEAISEEAPTADAIVSGIPGVGLAVMVADCIPLLMYSDVAVAAVHVGRRGLVNGVALSALSAMREIGADRIFAEIGPAICGSCYEVSPEIFEEVTAAHSLAAAQTPQGTPALNLPKALDALLTSHGVSVTDHHVCTVESSDHFSYRRDGVTGRQIGFISL